VSRGAMNLVLPTARICGLPTRQGIGPDQLHSTERKRTTHGEGIDQPPFTEGKSRPRHTGVAEAAGAWRLRPTVYEIFSFRLKDSSVTSVTVKMAFHWCGCIPPPSARRLFRTTPQTPLGRDSVPRRNEPSRTDCGVLRPSYTSSHRAGTTTTHQPRKEPRTAMEASNCHSQKEIAVRATRGSRRRPGLRGWDPWSMRYAPSSRG
jgi:hypothetical protein